MKRILILLVITLGGCSASHQVPQSKETFSFDYSPKESAPSGSVNMLLCQVQPYYVTSFQSSNNELFKTFKEALGSDIEELIVAKGFNLKGPFSSFDDMIFDDKKRSDIVIQIEINPQFSAAEGKWKPRLSAWVDGGGWTYTYSGKVSLIGKINLSGVEPLTNQKIWSKSVAIPNIENIIIQTSKRYDHMLQDYEMYQDPGVYNAVGRALSLQYAGIMNKIAAQINAEEFLSMKPQVKELKALKGY
ncbi:hypothetical protein [Limnovirga soli]|uniref:Uncharacterized protein n=1 Tax=Limnovirga soli TaxID=2656915 RepID=A0A8J8JSR7_9BACT|nr:hypothetical protein [Limnovirga soli]NNV53884.1 hypothetical protein [Limnovirga soli]